MTSIAQLTNDDESRPPISPFSSMEPSSSGDVDHSTTDEALIASLEAVLCPPAPLVEAAAIGETEFDGSGTAGGDEDCREVREMERTGSVVTEVAGEVAWMGDRVPGIELEFVATLVDCVVPTTLAGGEADIDSAEDDDTFVVERAGGATSETGTEDCVKRSITDAESLVSFSVFFFSLAL